MKKKQPSVRIISNDRMQFINCLDSGLDMFLINDGMLSNGFGIDCLLDYINFLRIFGDLGLCLSGMNFSLSIYK